MYYVLFHALWSTNFLQRFIFFKMFIVDIRFSSKDQVYVWMMGTIYSFRKFTKSKVQTKQYFKLKSFRISTEIYLYFFCWIHWLRSLLWCLNVLTISVCLCYMLHSVSPYFPHFLINRAIPRISSKSRFLNQIEGLGWILNIFSSSFKKCNPIDISSLIESLKLNPLLIRFTSDGRLIRQ